MVQLKFIVTVHIFYFIGENIAQTHLHLEVVLISLNK